MVYKAGGLMPSRYPIKMSFQVSLEMQLDISNLPEINVAAVCRKALQAEIDLHKGRLNGN